MRRVMSKMKIIIFLLCVIGIILGIFLYRQNKRKNVMQERTIVANGIKFFTESFGDKSKPAFLLISGAMSSARFWTDEFCQQLVDAGYFVIRYDHRDIGLSSAVDYATHIVYPVTFSTVKVAEASTGGPSGTSAFMLYSSGVTPDGTVKVTVKAPLLPAVAGALGSLLSKALLPLVSNQTVPFADAAKPVPVTIIFAPETPPVGDKIIVAGSTVKVAEASTGGPSGTSAFILYLSGATPGGTVKVTVKVPLLLAVAEALGSPVSKALLPLVSNQTMPTADAANPVPPTVIFAPESPLDGAKVMFEIAFGVADGLVVTSFSFPPHA